MDKIDRLQKAISERQAELDRVADALARSAYTLRRRSAVLRVLLIAFGALTAAQGIVDQLQAVPAVVSGIVFLALGVSIAALAGIETAFKFESRGAELNALAATCHSMVRQTDTAWHRKVRLETDPEQQARGAIELIELQDTKLQEVQEKAVTAGVDITLEVRRPFRASAAHAAEESLSLHPDNPHYFMFRDKPTVLVTSAEHYGAILNREFDTDKYLAELHKHGFNLTRTFTGVYCEDTKAFGITRNTLAPADGKLLCPWARSETPGYAGGGNKFDLTKWDDAYLKRLKAFLTQAGKRGIVVELVLFCPFYEDSMWKLSPMNTANNVNSVGKVARDAVYNRDRNGDLQLAQETLVKKLVAELNEFDNLYFEVCNEPYSGGVTDDWQQRIIDVIVDAEKLLPTKHLISLNIADGSKKIEKPHPAVSIFNFHYTSPPTAVEENLALNKVIGENETGFKGTGDTHYRMEAWEFLLAGGGLYNNLDYSFAVGHEDGTYKYPDKTPGGGNTGFRSQIHVLKEFLDGFDYIRMNPDEGVAKGGLPAKGRARVLSEPGKQYAVYLFGGPSAKPLLALPAGEYKAEWLSPVTGKVLQSEAITAKGMPVELASPKFDPDIALRIKRVEVK